MKRVRTDPAFLALYYSPSPHAAEQPRKDKPMKITSSARRALGIVLVCGLAASLVSQCSDTVAPSPPSQITIESGNNQYSLRGTTLRDPLVVRVRAADGTIPEEAHVVFAVVEGGGSVASATVRIDGKGLASTELTLGPEYGSNSVRASIQENSSKFVLFEATAANFYCPEQSDTLTVHYGQEHHLFLATHRSSLYSAVNTAGVVEVNVYPPNTTAGFAEIEGGPTFDTNIFDAAFSARGDFYVARRSFRSEILKIDTAGNAAFFARLDEDLPFTDLYAEIATNPSGLLVGCDAKGPFVVGCPDTLTRFAEATYPGYGINSDALAVDPRRQSEDPLGEDIYFIDKSTSSLMRLAMDSLAVEPRGLETVASLSAQQATFARGMVCEARDGNVYILVDSDETKQIVQVTPAGAVTELYDFFDRGDGDAAGAQRDLAYDEGFRRLYTIDTLNNNVLIYDVPSDLLVEMFDDPALQGTISTTGGSGERVGLAVLK
jgi:hypothetical protein